MKIAKAQTAGFTLVEIMIVVVIIGLLTAIAIPNLAKARVLSQKNACVSNIKQIEVAKTTWALETKQAAGDPCMGSDIFGPTKYIRDEPQCPAGGTYAIGTVSTAVACSKAVEGHSLW